MPVWNPSSFTGTPRDPRTGGFTGRTTQHRGAMLVWYGEFVADRVTAATLAAVKTVIEEAANYARDHHPWVARGRSQEATTGGGIEENIWTEEPWVTSRGVVKARWGAPSPALYLELGTRKMPAFPFIRPAQDATYPHLAPGIREQLR